MTQVIKRPYAPMPEVKIDFAGKDFTGEWPHFRWNVFIGGERFEYKTGVGHTVPYPKKDGKLIAKRVEVSFEEAAAFLKAKRSIYKAVTYNDVHELMRKNLYATIPQVDQVLDCLFRDAEILHQSFYDFCDDCGYSRDSLKALDIYRACCDIGERLKKAYGRHYVAEQKRIEALEL